MDEQLADILNTCLTRLEGGASVEDCLIAYPQHQQALEASLRAAVHLRALPRPSLPSATRALLETQMLALASARRTASGPSPALNGRAVATPNWRTFDPSAVLAGLLRTLGYRGPLARPLLRLASLALALVLALALSAGVYAAARVIIETIIPQSTVAPAETFTLDGPIEQLGAQEWVVLGLPVGVDAQTTIVGQAVLGASAHVSGVFLADGRLRAQRIVVDPLPAPPTPTAAPAPVEVPASAPPPPPSAPPPTAVPASAPPPGQGNDGKDKDKEKEKDKDKDKDKDKEKDKDKDKGKSK